MYVINHRFNNTNTVKLRSALDYEYYEVVSGNCLRLRLAIKEENNTTITSPSSAFEECGHLHHFRTPKLDVYFKALN